jgi:peptidoglycan/xylan/chitin deacetylase (PgdA/CDA1 family)
MHEIQWNVDSLDWKDPTPQQIYERVVGKVQPGSIVLLHNGAKNTPAALPSILETLQKEGYEIVPISQLIYNGTYKIDNNGTQIPTDQGTSSGG